jgi:serine/threonine protein kinase
VITEPDDRIVRAAEAIADGREVDLEATPEDAAEIAATLSSLQAVASVARAHRAALGAGVRETATGAEPESIVFTWGSLQVLERLGAGSFGEVFRARDPALGRDVALKLRPAEESAEGPAARRWLEEARRLARVHHPNVVHVYGAAVHEGRAGIWMELVHGRTLEQWLAEHGPMGWREACVVGLELCAALASVHAAGLVHNDVTAANVMREGGGGPERSGRIVLMDFGSGSVFGSPGSAGAFGTPLSTAPEVILGAAATPASDVWSLGALVYRLVTGRSPYPATTTAELVEAARSNRIVALRDVRPDVPLAFVEAVERALAPRPADRFAATSEFERALARALETSGASAPTVSRSWGYRALIGVGAVVAIVLAVLLLPRYQSRGIDGLSTSNGAHPPASPAPISAPAVSSPPVEAETPSAPSVASRFVRVTAGGETPVADGDMIAPGDQLALEIDTDEPLWIYALDEDRTGVVSALFPVAGLDLANPVPKGHHRLPGGRSGQPLDWQVTSAGGRETFLFVASREPVTAVEARVATAAPAHQGEPVAYATLGAGDVGAFRGVTGLAPSKAPVTSGHGGRLEALARDLESRSGSRPWFRKVVVENPAP